MLYQQEYVLMEIRGDEIEVTKGKKNKRYCLKYNKSDVDTSNWWAEDICDKYNSINK